MAASTSSSSTTTTTTTAAEPPQVFPITADALHDMTADSEEGLSRLHSLGGVEGLARALQVSLKEGLNVPAEAPRSVGHAPGAKGGSLKTDSTTPAAHATRKRTDQDEGCDAAAAAAARVREFGANVLPDAAETTFLDFVWECFEDHMLQVLIVSAAVSLCLGLLVPAPGMGGAADHASGWIDGAAILLSVCLVTGVTSINNYQKEQKFRELSASKPPKIVHVLRCGGKKLEVLDSQLLVGDLLYVSGGDVLTVDGVVVQAAQLKTDESATTGENDDVLKVAYADIDGFTEEEEVEEGDGETARERSPAAARPHPGCGPRDCMIRSGTDVVEGEGLVLVTAVGVNSFAGRIAMAVRSETEETPLQEKLTVLADRIGYVGMAAAALMFTVLSAKEAYDTLVHRSHPFHYKKYLDILMTAVTIVVVAVPEGLPLSVTIALAYSMKQMLRENNLVRHLAACETMGGATTVCTDKTGTITLGEMTLTDGYTGDGTHFIVPPPPARGAKATGAGAKGTTTSSSGSTTRGGEAVDSSGSERPVYGSPTTDAAHSSDTAAKLFSDVFGSAATAAAAAGEEENSTRDEEKSRSGGGAERPAPSLLRELLIEGIAVNTKCDRWPVLDPDTGAITGYHVSGNKTEQALLGFVERLGVDPFEARERVLSRVCHVHHRAHAHAADPTTAAHRNHSNNPLEQQPQQEEEQQQEQRDTTDATAGEGAPAGGEPLPSAGKEMRVYPFTSARKLMTTAIALRRLPGTTTATAPTTVAAGTGDESEMGLEETEASAMAASGDGGGVVRFHVKGASELVLARCATMLVDCGGEGGKRGGDGGGGAVVPIDDAARQRLQRAITSLSRRRLRTLAIAYAEEPIRARRRAGTETRERSSHSRTTVTLPSSPPTTAAATTDTTAGHVVDACAFPDTDSELPPLTLIALVGLRDPVRPEVLEAVARCRRAGVTVRMITGDNKATAVAVAREVGIYGPVWRSDRPRYRGGEPGSGVVAGEPGLVLEGRAFREAAQSERTLNAILPKLQVISRASPLDKQLLVAALMRRGEVVAVTGDGTNDAPALKNASVGFAMHSGTDVAKAASDVVILDDNFSTIVSAMRWGRNVHDSICKFLQFQMTVNVAAVAVSFFGALLDATGEAPLKPVQLLWVNLIMDTLAALALATEPPTECILDRAPKPKDAPLLSRRLWANIAGQSLYQVAVQLWLLHSGHRFFGDDIAPGSDTHLSIVFNVFVLMQLFNELNARILDDSLNVFAGLAGAPMFLAVVGACFAVQVLGVQYGGAIMCAAPLSWPVWVRCLQLACVPIPLGVALRLVPVPAGVVPPPPLVLDAAEEKALWAAAQQRRRPTLREAAAKVRCQLRVVAALKRAVEDGRKREAAAP